MDERHIRWLCRRGMKELDLMLGRYLDERWPEADDDERAGFVALLELQDPDLWQRLTSGRSPDDVIRRIRSLSGL